MDAVEELKQEAGIAACKYVKNGMKIGLGTGSTVKYTIIELGRRIAEEDLQNGIYLGETHIWDSNRREWIRTPLGGFINHSENPNCFINKNIHYHHGDQKELFTIRPIKAGEELTVYYDKVHYE